MERDLLGMLLSFSSDRQQDEHSVKDNLHIWKGGLKACIPSTLTGKFLYTVHIYNVGESISIEKS